MATPSNNSPDAFDYDIPYEYLVELKEWLIIWRNKRGGDIPFIAEYMGREYINTVLQLNTPSPALTGAYGINVAHWVKQKIIDLVQEGLPPVIDGIPLPFPPDFNPYEFEIEETDLPAPITDDDMDTADYALSPAAQPTPAPHGNPQSFTAQKPQASAPSTPSQAHSNHDPLGISPAQPSTVTATPGSNLIETDEDPHSNQMAVAPNVNITQDNSNDAAQPSSPESKLTTRAAALQVDRGAPAAPKQDQPEKLQDVKVQTPTGFELVNLGNVEVMRCRGCLTQWSCRNCETPEGVTAILENVMLYDEEDDEEVVGPDATIHNWRPTRKYKSPWADSDWFADEKVRQDIKSLYGVKLGTLRQTAAADNAQTGSFMTAALKDVDHQDVLIYDHDVAELLRNWRRYEVTYSTLLMLNEHDGTPVNGPPALAARRRMLMCEALLIGRHEMTMGDNDLGWDLFHRKEQVETRLAEINTLDKRLAELRPPGPAERKGIKAKLANIPLAGRFFGKMATPVTPSDVAALQGDVDKMTSDIQELTDENDSATPEATEEQRAEQSESGTDEQPSETR